GFKVTDEFKSKYQEYCREIFERMTLMMEISSVSSTNLDQKLQLSAFVVYLFRIASYQTFTQWEPQTWKTIINCQLNTILKMAQNQLLDQNCLDELVYPLIHVCLSIQLCNINILTVIATTIMRYPCFLFICFVCLFGQLID
ncbi:hypothetical protein RFI_11372, partial [Reticulomyxa filosa]